MTNIFLNNNKLDKFYTISILIIAIAILILNTYYFIYQDQLKIISFSMMIYHLVFRNIFNKFPQLFPFIIYLVLSLSILLAVYISLRKIKWFGIVLFILYVLINIPLFDTNQLGL